MSNKRSSDNKKRSILSTFTCPAGCGTLVSVEGVNDHLDRCLGVVGVSNDDGDGVKAGVFYCDTDFSNHCERRGTVATETNDITHQPENEITSIGGVKRARSQPPVAYTPPPASVTDAPNAFSHMMKRSAAVFSKANNKENLIRHRFHLHNVSGHITWTSVDGDENSICMESLETKRKTTDNRERVGSIVSREEIQWSTVIKMKGMKEYELAISAYLPSYPGSNTDKLVRRHSRLSVS